MKNLRKARQAKGLTVQELADILGFSRNAVTRYELGTRSPDAEFIKKASRALNKSADYLLGLIEEDKDLK